MKIQNVEVALRLFECGPGWKVVAFESQSVTAHQVVFRLMHVDGYAEEMPISHENLHDNPVGIMAMVREWIKQRTFAGIAEQKPVVKIAPQPVAPPTPCHERGEFHDWVLTSPIRCSRCHIEQTTALVRSERAWRDQLVPKVAPSPKREARTRRITLEED